MPGLYYEEFEIGQTFDHPIRRTVTETDNVLFTTMTHNPAYLHLDEEYCKNETEFGQRLVNSCFTLALMVGVTVYDTTLGTTVGNLGWDDVRFPRPVFHGDTLHFRTEITAMAARATEIAEAALGGLRAGAVQHARDEQAAELARLEALAAVNPNIRTEEIEFRRDYGSTLVEVLGNATVRLDAVRVGLAT